MAKLVKVKKWKQNEYVPQKSLIFNVVKKYLKFDLIFLKYSANQN